MTSGKMRLAEEMLSQETSDKCPLSLILPQVSLCPHEHQPFQPDHLSSSISASCDLTAPSGGPALSSVVPSVGACT